MKRIVLLGILVYWFLQAANVVRAEVPWGVHLLEPSELPLALQNRTATGPVFVTVPMALSDRRTEVWNTFFETSFKAGIIPMVRWVTTYRDGAWQVPSKKEIVEASTFLSSLNWPGRRIVILFNEPNHAIEWGGSVDPEGYAATAAFASSWLKSDRHGYEVLPAGLDAAAPNGKETMDSLAYLNRMYKARPELFEMLDGWASHSYPNPDFSASAYRRTKNSLWGFEWEWRRLKELTGRDYPMYITETGWKQSKWVNRALPAYYRYAVNSIWSDPRVKAVTVFVLRGFNGPFAAFSLLDSEGKPTAQFDALLKAL